MFAKSVFLSLVALAMNLQLAGTVTANEPHIEPITNFANDTVKQWIANPIVINAIKAQNEESASLSQSDIDTLDQQWRAETGAGSRPMIDEILGNELSKFLSGAKADTQGLATEIFVMDNKGLNVGQSDVTSDYWQGDEAKWQKTYLAGSDSLFIDEIEQDESTQTFQSQVSMPIVDPATGEVIGAITVGVNVDALL